nr:adenosylcobinamide amidohydrolase [Kibdelosporangium sp. MJ126-NF4]CEL13607.1 Adenosylcobinamide amidohydrolase [Kibdelosporangium sp. MJ126-NF4]CTQ99293.1 Adenosylcobinamide amidohydrolase (EC 3.5.1.90) [Kibdelosporangium sp. MJ126-NF4]
MFSILDPTVVQQRDNGRPMLVWALPLGTRAISTGVVGGGIGACEWIVNVRVEYEYHRDPVDHLTGLAAEWNLTGPGTGLLTAARLRDFTTGSDADAECVTSVGLTHPVFAAAPAEGTGWTPGTINTVCWVPVGLGDAALVNSVVTATEAKAQALRDAGVAGTGTPSDAIVVCCPDQGSELYGGPRSQWGQRLANAVYQATYAGAVQWLRKAGE